MSETHDSGAGAGGNAGGGDVAAFLNQIPETIRGEAYFKDIKDVANLATKGFHQSKLIGKLSNGASPESIVILPGADDAQGWNQVYDRLGRPANPDGYTLEAPKNLPEGLGVDAELQKSFVARAHELGLSTRQAQGLFAWWNDTRGAAHTASATEASQRADQAIRELQADKDFGGSAYEKNLGLAKAALAHYGTPELIAELERSGDGNRPQVIRMFAKIGAELAEDGLIGGRDSGGNAGLDNQSPAEIQQKMNALRADEGFKKRYHSKDRNTRQSAIAEMNALAEALHTSRQAAAGAGGDTI